MDCFNCPLCCQQGFRSITAFREHLLYYIYRPLNCPLCNISVGGVHGLARHLETHLTVIDHNFELNYTDKNHHIESNISNTNKKDEGSQSIKNTKLYLKINPNESYEENILPEIPINIDKSDNLLFKDVPLIQSNCGTTKSNTIEENKEINFGMKIIDNDVVDDVQSFSDAVRAFVCNKCGSKIVGKDIYFKHIQDDCIKKINSIAYEDSFEIDNAKINKIIESDSEDSETNDIQQNFEDRVDDKTGSQPYYIHKKFDHDLERKLEFCEESGQNDVQCYIQNFQSLLVDKLNQTLGNDISTPYLNKLNIESQEKDFSKIASTLPEESNNTRDYEIIDKVERTTTKSTDCITKTNSEDGLDEVDSNEISGTFLCNLCGNNFKNKKTLDNHKGLHQNGKEFNCSKCNYSCYTSSGLRTHVFEVHSTKHKKEIVCIICLEKFKKKYSLERHIKRKHENNKIICKYCDKVFLCKEDMAQHSILHFNDSAVTCEHCNKMFTSISSLKRHKFKHSAEKKSFGCNVCSKTFSRKDSLLTHSKLHNPDSLYSCKCDKKFSRKINLISHSHVHNKALQHICKYCKKKFKTPGSLKKHFAKCK